MNTQENNKLIAELKELAKPLIGSGENIEYTRGICELIADIDGKAEMPHAERSQEIAHELGIDVMLYSINQ